MIRKIKIKIIVFYLYCIDENRWNYLCLYFVENLNWNNFLRE